MKKEYRVGHIAYTNPQTKETIKVSDEVITRACRGKGISVDKKGLQQLISLIKESREACEESAELYGENYYGYRELYMDLYIMLLRKRNGIPDNYIITDESVLE